ncbi:hypothetical protein GIB67_029416 [Kingdonia uniflora]|uniref:Uncharacterized protein n=1 Tax=Kingdonia uniflora TaxID=39325 RepID=A0A7J7NYK4_9MAGN|nr:hypothetical protein GIB67_029416 [Kingdonia uniflora]
MQNFPPQLLKNPHIEMFPSRNLVSADVKDARSAQVLHTSKNSLKVCSRISAQSGTSKYLKALKDEDLGFEIFHAGCYISVIKEEELYISQPVLDTTKSEVHHQITARGRRLRVHRWTHKLTRGRRYDNNSTGPPCTGWVSIFSREAWRCTWYMLQNDLIHGWGADMQLGYCAQGEQTQNVGVVDSEYIVHQGLPTLGAVNEKTSKADVTKNSSGRGTPPPSVSHLLNDRYSVTEQSYIELEIFKNQWKKAVREDQCWINPFPLNGMKSRCPAAAGSD